MGNVCMMVRDQYFVKAKGACLHDGKISLS